MIPHDGHWLPLFSLWPRHGEGIALVLADRSWRVRLDLLDLVVYFSASTIVATEKREGA